MPEGAEGTLLRGARAVLGVDGVGGSVGLGFRVVFGTVGGACKGEEDSGRKAANVHTLWLLLVPQPLTS